MEGRYTRLDGEGAPRLLFTPEREIDPAAVLYCGQWFNRGELLLDFDAIVDLGIDVGGLKLRTEISPVLGTVLVGTDPSHADRYAMYQRNDNSLVEVALSDPSPVANPLYRTDFSDPNHEVFSIEGHIVVNLPRMSGAEPSFQRRLPHLSQNWCSIPPPRPKWILPRSPGRASLPAIFPYTPTPPTTHWCRALHSPRISSPIRKHTIPAIPRISFMTTR